MEMKITEPGYYKSLKDNGLLPQIQYSRDNVHSLALATRDELTTSMSIKWIRGCDYVEIYIRKPISNPMDALYGGNQYHVTELKPLTNYPLFEELAAVDGITIVSAAPYIMLISKAEAFEWEELVPHIIDAWKTYQLKKEFK